MLDQVRVRQVSGDGERDAEVLTSLSMLHIMCHMKTATVRQVRHDFGSVLKLVQRGEEVTITLRNKPVARLSPPAASSPRTPKMPDFAARLAERFPGGPVVDGALADWISEERDRG